MAWPEKTLPTTDASEKRTLGAGVFRRCESCGQTLTTGELEAAFEVCPLCGFHHKLDAEGWRRLLLDDGQLEEWDDHLQPDDPLRFSDGRTYKERVAASQRKTGARESIETGRGRLSGRPIAYGAFVFAFMGGSMGSVAGEKVTRLFERAAKEELPVVLLQASGGARMQEGILSLMQMAKSVAALERLRRARIPFISVLLHPTTGGVAASFAFLGDVNIAEPKALIGFAGPRVIENTIRQTLPPGFQRAEFLLEHGMVDLIVPRGEMRPRIVTLLNHMMGGRRVRSAAPMRTSQRDSPSIAGMGAAPSAGASAAGSLAPDRASQKGVAALDWDDKGGEPPREGSAPPKGAG
jgi:acetyl-CoA carboxylase carboxyl transferase subunit beta